MAVAVNGANLQPKSLAESIADIVQREIVAGELGPGQRLVERELIDRFGVSSIPVREALRELESRGLVVRKVNCGCSVVELSAKEALRMCELRRALEPKVVEWAASRVTPEGAAELRRQLDRLKHAAETEDYAEFFQEDMKFHRIIWQMGDNPYAVRALESVLGSLFASGLIRRGQPDGVNLKLEVAKHERLLDAICEFDGQRASLLLLEIAAGFEKHLR
jgi:DNA-binding GntR family transcriptional regulator